MPSEYGAARAPRCRTVSPLQLWASRDLLMAGMVDLTRVLTSLAAAVDVRGECENLVGHVLSLVPGLAHAIAWLVGDTMLLGVDPVRLVNGVLGSADVVSRPTSQNEGVGDTRFRSWALAGCARCISRTVTVSSRIDG